MDYNVVYNFYTGGNTLKIQGPGTADAGVWYGALFGGYNERKHKRHLSFNVDPFRRMVTDIDVNLCIKHDREQKNEDITNWICDCRIIF